MERRRRSGHAGADLLEGMKSYSWGENYIILGFRVRNGMGEEGKKYFIDYYFGPDELKRYLKDGRSDPEKLIVMAEELERNIDAQDPIRRRFLLEQVKGLKTTALLQRGDNISYLDIVRECYGIEPSPPDEEKIKEAIETLSNIFKCKPCETRDKIEHWKMNHRVPKDKILEYAGLCKEEARERTQDILKLPDGERVIFQLVEGVPWLGYNWYHKDEHKRESALTSLVQINRDAPIVSYTLLNNVCHESYPGHHTDHAIKEALLYRDGEGNLEASVGFFQTPEFVIAEGIAENAAGLVFGEYENRLEWLNRTLNENFDVERDGKILRAMSDLSEARNVAAYELNIIGLNEQSVIEHLTDLFLTREDAERRVKFVSHPLFGPYIFCYNKGYDLVKAVRETGDAEKIRFLYEHQLTPSLLKDIIEN